MSERIAIRIVAVVLAATFGAAAPWVMASPEVFIPVAGVAALAVYVWWTA